MRYPTFSEFLSEGRKSLADYAKGKNDPVTTYPKTNTKRYMDEWNSRLGPWVRQAEKDGNHVLKRAYDGETGEMILDVVNDDNELISTAVVTGTDDVKSGDHTFDFYNQTDIQQDNKYRVNPDNVKYEDGYVWREMTMNNASHQDTRNAPMSLKDIGNTGRVDDTTSSTGRRINTSTPSVSEPQADDELDAPQPDGMADGQEFVPMSRAAGRRKPANAAADWAALTKPKPGRTT